MNIQNISADSERINAIENLYIKVFPQEERLDFEFLTAKAKQGKGYFLGLFKEENLAGMMYYAEYKGIIYILYFAIDPQYQSKGYGKMLLEHLFEKFNEHKIILLVEELEASAENIEQRIRRKNFYLRNGFAENEQFLETLGLKFELLHRQGRTAFVTDYKEIREYYYSE